MTEQQKALESFDESEVGLSKGALSLILGVTDRIREESFPVSPDRLLTPSGGQVSGIGGGRIRRILRRHGIDRVLSDEGGRTSRGSIERMRRYVALVNQLSASGQLDINAAEKFWVGRVLNYFDSRPFTLKLDPNKSLRFCIHAVIEQAVERQREVRGTMFAGAVMQHLVGAKLEIASEENLHHHGFSVADAPTNRSGDFVVGDVAVHVTTAPSEALLRKCEQNLSSGLRPFILTTEDGVGGAKAIAKQSGLEDRIDVLDIEQFMVANVYERSHFKSERRPSFVRHLIDTYNKIVTETETDPSLKIAFED